MYEMKCAIMQPTYLPWQGYLEMMLSSDCFVYFDDVQFVRKSWQQRNRIKSPQGELMLSVPVLKKGELEQKISEAKINNQTDWQYKHLASIEHNYHKAPFFNRYIEELRRIYSQKYEKLIDLNLEILDFLRSGFNINTPTILSSQLDVKGARNEYIIAICRKIGAEILYDAAGAAELLDCSAFEKAGIQLKFQRYSHPVYRQLHGDFKPYLSALDLLLNEGENGRTILASGAAL